MCFTAGCNQSDENEEENIFSRGIQNTAEFITGLFVEDVLTEDDSLEGERVFGEDKYVGVYEVSYRSFNGTEYLFGGSQISDEESKKVQVTYQSDIEEGEAVLIWNKADNTEEEQILFEGSGEYSETITIGGGWEYLSLEGTNLNGDINVEIEYE